MIDIPLCEGAEIFTYYKVMAIQKVRDKRLTVLKTDLHNESEQQPNNKNILKAISPYISKGYGVEIDISTCHEAAYVMRDYDNIETIHGSITDLPLENDSIDLLFDFSTIDHVIDYDKAMGEYKRVTRPEGKLVIIVWLIEGETKEIYPSQYCFNRTKFEAKLLNYFGINCRQLLLSNDKDKSIGTRNLFEYDLGILSK